MILKKNGVISPENLNENISTIKSNADKLLLLINNLLDLSKLDAGKISLNLQLIDLNEFLRSITESFVLPASEKGIKVSYKSKVKALEICMDPEMMEKVFLNLLSNAYKFTKKFGNINVTLLAPIPYNNNIFKTKYKTKPPEQLVEIIIKDTGIGIAKEDINNIFDRFFSRQGTGIGLSLVKEYISLHKGEISEHPSNNCYWY